MVQSVELLLDDAAEAHIRAQWDLLADLGVASPTKRGSTAPRTSGPLATVSRGTDGTDDEVSAIGAADDSAEAAADAQAEGDEISRPHVTVAVASEIWPRIDRQLRNLPFQPFSVRLGGVLVFGSRRLILVRLVVPCEPLLTWQRRIHEVVAPCPHIPGNLRPGRWTPHVTLARKVQPGWLGPGIRQVAADRDFPATVVGMRRWDGDRRQSWAVAGEL